MGTGTYKRWLHDFFRYVGGGMAGCSSHSVRKSAASWATRCGASDPEIQRVGRWAILSVSFRRYLNHGITIQKKYLGVLRRTHTRVPLLGVQDGRRRRAQLKRRLVSLVRSACHMYKWRLSRAHASSCAAVAAAAAARLSSVHHEIAHERVEERARRHVLRGGRLQRLLRALLGARHCHAVVRLRGR